MWNTFSPRSNPSRKNGISTRFCSAFEWKNAQMWVSLRVRPARRMGAAVDMTSLLNVGLGSERREGWACDGASRRRCILALLPISNFIWRSWRFAGRQTACRDVTCDATDESQAIGQGVTPSRLFLGAADRATDAGRGGERADPAARARDCVRRPGRQCPSWPLSGCATIGGYGLRRRPTGDSGGGARGCRCCAGPQLPPPGQSRIHAAANGHARSWIPRPLHVTGL